MAQPQEPAEGIHLDGIQPGAHLGQMAPTDNPQRTRFVERRLAEGSTEEPDVGKPLVRFCEG
jgi:hypothetical protein